MSLALAQGKVGLVIQYRIQIPREKGIREDGIRKIFECQSQWPSMQEREKVEFPILKTP